MPPKHLLDERLDFHEQNKKINKCYKIGVIKNLSFDLPCNALLRISKSCLRPIIYYDDIIYGKPNNESK